MPKPFHVPGLYEKFSLLIETGHFSDWPEIGAAFEQQPGTVKWWGHGGARHPANHIPAKHYDRFVEVVANCFPPDYGSAQIASLIEGSAADFENELRLQATASLYDIIEREGDRTACRLYTKNRAGRDLVSTDLDEIPEPKFSLRLNQRFRLDFATPFAGSHIFAVQHSEADWAPVAAEFISARKAILVPGVKSDGTPAFMWESTRTGPHRFVVVHASRPIPHSARQPARHRASLDIRGLNDLASFLDELRPRERCIFYVDLAID